VPDRGTDYRVATSGRSESLSAANGCDWSTEVSDVYDGASPFNALYVITQQ